MPMAPQPNDADIFLNRANVAFARSQRLIQSWLPAQSQAEENRQVEDEDEEDFDGLDELGGLGSKRKAKDEGLPDGVFKRNKLASNDRLLEQLLGKKAVQARKKSLQSSSAGRSGYGVQQHGVAKPWSTTTVPRKRDAESEDEEEGRAAAFKSKKVKAKPANREETERDVAPRLDGDDKGEQESSGVAREDEATAAMPDRQSDSEEIRPAKKGAGSYLDELLSQKATKGKKKRKKKPTNEIAVP